VFGTVLVANRGEIAVRVIRTLRALGIRSVAVYSDADAGARHVRAADVAVRIGPAPAAQSYLSIPAILAAAAATGAEAIHPGYGFLAENAAFARACEEAGIVFVGPPAAAIEAMGDKVRAKQAVAAAGVPVVPGSAEPDLDDEQVAAAAVQTGFPVLLKPSAGGGGKGMRLVRGEDGLREEIAAARREAVAAFGDGTLLVERYVERPRHIEIQVLADAHGTVLHLGERECSLQRRHQKIIEEAPSPLLTDLPGGAAVRARMGAAAVEAARAVGYTGAGTVEFIVAADAPGDFFFLEMNTRLQVEHPVTEMVTGVDLVEWQLRVAAGEPLAFGQDAVRSTGHAIEARVYAEDPARGFLPTGGPVLALAEPVDLPHVRVDSGMSAGMDVGSRYDPMLAKVIAWGSDRDAARRRLDAALAGTGILGVTTNIGFLRDLLAHPDVAAGRLDTGLVERALSGTAGAGGREGIAAGHGFDAAAGARVGGDPDRGAVPDEVLAAAGLERLLALAGRGTDVWDAPTGWRLGEPAWATWRIEAPGRDAVLVGVRARRWVGPEVQAEVRLGDGEPVLAAARGDAGGLVVTFAGRTHRFLAARDGRTLWLGRDGRTWALAERDRLSAARTDAGGGAPKAGMVRSPMPGVVLAVKVAAGEQVAAGQALVIVEAMKMEHTLTAPTDGTVTDLPARQGAPVRVDELLAVVTP
jgi:acetyl-CoA/propionyl-CoA carboxylase, biotin carboxylase, biotin carboxyl carrier protein